MVSEADQATLMRRAITAPQRLRCACAWKSCSRTHAMAAVITLAWVWMTRDSC